MLTTNIFGKVIDIVFLYSLSHLELN